MNSVERPMQRSIQSPMRLNLNSPNDRALAIKTLSQILAEFRDAREWNDCFSSHVFVLVDRFRRILPSEIADASEQLFKKIKKLFEIVVNPGSEKKASLNDPCLIGPLQLIEKDDVNDEMDVIYLFDRTVLMNRGDVDRFLPLYTRYFANRNILPIIPQVKEHRFAKRLIELIQSIEGILLPESSQELVRDDEVDLSNPELVKSLFLLYSDVLEAAADSEEALTQTFFDEAILEESERDLSLAKREMLDLSRKAEERKCCHTDSLKKTLEQTQDVREDLLKLRERELEFARSSQTKEEERLKRQEDERDEIVRENERLNVEINEINRYRDQCVQEALQQANSGGGDCCVMS